MENPLISFDRRFAEQVFEKQKELLPSLAGSSSTVRESCIRDILLHFNFLDQAIAAESTVLFRNYIVWIQVILNERGLGDESLSAFLESLQQLFHQLLVPAAYEEILPYLQSAREGLTEPTKASDISAIRPDNPFYPEAQAYLSAVMGADRHLALQKIQDFLQQGLTVKDIYLHVFQPVQHELGRLWQVNRISIAQEHFGTALTQLAMAQLYPQVFSTERVGFRLVAACVGSELHEIGIRMVADFFEMAGWDTYYLGANVPAVDIIAAVEEQDADLLALSITMSTQITQLRDLIAKIRGGIKHDIKILVGGHPFNVDPKAWQVVGADGYAADAESAVDTAFMLVR